MNPTRLGFDYLVEYLSFECNLHDCENVWQRIGVLLLQELSENRLGCHSCVNIRRWVLQLRQQLVHTYS